LFVQQKRKHGKVVFLMFRSASKHVVFALGVDPTARDTLVKVEVLTLFRKLRPSQCRVDL